MKIWKHKKIIICLASVVLALAIIVGGCAWYVSDYYHADVNAIEAFAADCNVTTTILSDGVIAYGEPNADVGLIFYPGGKVEYTAYEPLMKSLAAQGVLCILIKMPFNLAVLDMNAADGVCDFYPEIDRWYIGGHSLGGAMAACYAEKHADQLEGLVLLGSYSSKNISDKTLRVLSVFGSEDGILNREKYDKYKPNLPADFTEIEIDGGCHAYFGMYGNQKGDGTPTITPKDQIAFTTTYIVDFVKIN